MIFPKLIKQSVSQWSNYFLFTCHIAIYETCLGEATHTHTPFISFLGIGVTDVI